MLFNKASDGTGVRLLLKSRDGVQGIAHGVQMIVLLCKLLGVGSFSFVPFSLFSLQRVVQLCL